MGHYFLLELFLDVAVAATKSSDATLNAFTCFREMKACRSSGVETNLLTPVTKKRAFCLELQHRYRFPKPAFLFFI